MSGKSPGRNKTSYIHVLFILILQLLYNVNVGTFNYEQRSCYTMSSTCEICF